MLLSKHIAHFIIKAYALHEVEFINNHNIAIQSFLELEAKMGN